MVRTLLRLVCVVVVLATAGCGARSGMLSEEETLGGGGAGTPGGGGTTPHCDSSYASVTFEGQTVRLTGKCFDEAGGPGAGFLLLPDASWSSFAVTACNTGGEYLHMTTENEADQLGAHRVSLFNFDYRDGSPDYVESGPGTITVESLSDEAARGRFEVQVAPRFGGAAISMQGEFCTTRWPDSVGP